MLLKVEDNFSATLVGNYTTTDTTFTLSSVPSVVTSGYLTVYDFDGNQYEKIKFTGVSGSTITGCLRGLSFTTNSDSEITDNKKELKNGMVVKLSVSQNYINDVADVLNGDTAAGGVIKNPSERVINDSRHLVDKEYADAISSSGINAMLVTDNGGVSININSGYYILNGDVNEYPGVASQDLTDDATNYIELLDGALSLNTTEFSNDAIPLAIAVCSGGDITSLTDARPFYTGVDVKEDGGLDRDTNGIFVNLGTDPGLEVVEEDGLAVKLKDNGGLQKDSDGVSMIGKNTVVMTAGETINGATTPVPVYQDSSDSEVYACDGDDVDKLNFIGFAITDGTDGNNITVQTSGIVSGFTGLTAGENYYLSTTAGSITTTQPNYNRSIGISISATDILIINNHKFSYSETDASLPKTITIPGKTLDENSVIKISGLIRGDCYGGSYPLNFYVTITYGGETIGFFNPASHIDVDDYITSSFEILLQGKNSTSSQRSHSKVISYSTDSTGAREAIASSNYSISVDSTVSQNLVITATKTEGTSTGFSLPQILIETIK